MRFDELSIQTHREAPSNSRTEGFAFLVRAGYLLREGQPLRLAEMVDRNLRNLYQELGTGSSSTLRVVGTFFSRLGLVVTASRTAPEFFIPIQGGDAEILVCASCGYASRREISGVRKQPLDPQSGVLPIEKVATPECSTIESLANFLHISKEQTAKALMYTRISDGRFLFIVVRGDMQLSEAKLRQCIGVARPATEAEIIAAGAVPGYASPIGLQEALVIVDDLIPLSPNLVAGANQAGYHLLNVNYPRDFHAELVADVVLPRDGDACCDCGAPFELCTAETVAGASAIHFERLLLPLAEAHHDSHGLSLAVSIAPFDVYLMSVPGKTIDTSAEAETLYRHLSEAGISVLYDDRNERAGVKFNDADLIGCPWRITVGERGLLNGMVELKARKAVESKLVPLDSILNEMRNELAGSG